MGVVVYLKYQMTTLDSLSESSPFFDALTDAIPI
jgi:hypothetical protein